MKYGYFKLENFQVPSKGALGYYYEKMKMIPNIKVYYDHCGKERPFLYKVLEKISNGDSLYVLNIYNLGTKQSTIFEILEILKKEDIKFFIKDKEISLDKVFKQIEKMRTYNREHLKSQIYDSDILKSVLDKLEKY